MDNVLDLGIIEHYVHSTCDHSRVQHDPAKGEPDPMFAEV